MIEYCDICGKETGRAMVLGKMIPGSIGLSDGSIVCEDCHSDLCEPGDDVPF